MIVPLKVTTDYTLMQSLIKVKDLVSFCVSKNIKNCQFDIYEQIYYLE